MPETLASNHSAILEALPQADLEQFPRINREMNEKLAQESAQVTQA